MFSVCSVFRGSPEVLQLRVYFHLHHRGPAQTCGIWHTPILQRQVTQLDECLFCYRMDTMLLNVTVLVNCMLYVMLLSPNYNTSFCVKQLEMVTPAP